MCTSGEHTGPSEDKTKIEASKKVHVSMVGEEVGIIGKKGEKR